MNGLFRFTLDSYFEVQDQPKGWDSAKIVIERNDEYSGLFINYLTELEFWGDGYDYINNLISTNGFCSSVLIEIDYQCSTDSGFERVFTGFINVPNTEIDHEKCTVKCSVEADDVYANFLKASEKPIQVPVWLTNDILYCHSVSDGSHYDSDTFYIQNSNDIFEMLSYMISEYTNSQITLVSDFFSTTEMQTDFWEITLSGATLKVGDTIDIRYRTYFNEIVTATVPFNTSEAQTLQDCIQHFISNVTDPTNDFRSKNDVSGTYFDHTKWANAEVSGRTIQLESWLPMQAPEFTITGTAPVPDVAITQIQAYQMGGKNLRLVKQNGMVDENAYANIQYWWDLTDISTQESLVSDFYDGKADHIISFKDLYLQLDKIFCLGMKMEYAGSTRYLRIEPLEYFFGTNITNQIGEPINIKTTYDTQQNFDIIQVGTEVTGVRAQYKITPMTVTGLSGTNTLTMNAPYQPFGWYLLTNGTDFEPVFVLSVVGTTLTVTRNLIYNYTNATTWAIAGLTETSRPSMLNAPASLKTGNCMGDELDLTHEIITDIEQHWIQIDYSMGANNIHGAFTKQLELIKMYLNAPFEYYSNRYKYKVNLTTSTGTRVVERFAYNGLLTNHHHVINNYIRIKRDVAWKPQPGSEYNGQTLTYPNTATKRPFIIHNFDYYLSFSEIQDMLTNPQDIVQVSLDRGNSYVDCWVKRIEMDINTKKCTFELYEV